MNSVSTKDMSVEDRQRVVGLYAKRVRFATRLDAVGGTGFRSYCAHVRTWEAVEYISVASQISMLTGRLDRVVMAQALRRYYHNNHNDPYGKRKTYEPR